MSLLYVRAVVKAGAKRESVTRKGDRFAVSVREEAERNQANHRVRELLAREYGVRVNAVRIVSGHRAPSKLLSITGISEKR